MENEFKKAFSYAFFLLSKRDYSISRLLEKIKKKFPNLKDEEINLLKKELIESKLLDEKRAITTFFVSKMEKGWGRRKIKRNLLKLGFSKELIDEIILTVPFDYSFILKEIEKKYELNDKKEIERVKRFLAQRGFSFQEVYEILNMRQENKK